MSETNETIRDFLDRWPMSGYELEAYCAATLVPALIEAERASRSSPGGGPGIEEIERLVDGLPWLCRCGSTVPGDASGCEYCYETLRGPAEPLVLGVSARSALLSAVRRALASAPGGGTDEALREVTDALVAFGCAKKGSDEEARLRAALLAHPDLSRTDGGSTLPGAMKPELVHARAVAVALQRVAAGEPVEAVERDYGFPGGMLASAPGGGTDEALRDAAEGVLYCVTCWDNPGRNLCERHLDALRRALSAPASTTTGCGVETVSGACGLPLGHGDEHDDRPLAPSPAAYTPQPRGEAAVRAAMGYVLDARAASTPQGTRETPRWTYCQRCRARLVEPASIAAKTCEDCRAPSPVAPPPSTETEGERER